MTPWLNTASVMGNWGTVPGLPSLPQALQDLRMAIAQVGALA
ncbi:MAG TPA: hypothetical protein VLK82_01005 [Candidatus Tectomicrobia bacterium]|nr:hypothetical protein [Candidatus Tectomicrobia bacterium]